MSHSSQEPSRQNSFRELAITSLKGIAMGAADVVPGVSGGTIAFITGIYERLLNALKSCHPLSLKILFQQGFTVFWQRIDGSFLLALFSGVLLSIFSLAKLINHLLDTQTIAVWSFFFGLVLASVCFLTRQVKKWTISVAIMLAIGVFVAVSISLLRPAQLPDTWWMMAISGFIAICAMILPGISGSFLLLLMGMYSVFIDALSRFDLVLLVSFGLGCFTGLIAFSHLLSFLLRQYFTAMMGLLTGFLLGSLSVIWPWKQVVETTTNRHGEVIPLIQKNISPFQYEIINNQSDQLWLALTLMFAGFLSVFFLEYLANYLTAASEE